MIRCILFLLISLIFGGKSVLSQEPIKVGSKLFNESVILGEMITQIIESEGEEVDFFDHLGGTRILWNALLEGEIDVLTKHKFEGNATYQYVNFGNDT